MSDAQHYTMHSIKYQYNLANCSAIFWHQGISEPTQVGIHFGVEGVSLAIFGGKAPTSNLNGHLKKIGEVKTSPAKYKFIVMTNRYIRHPLVLSKTCRVILEICAVRSQKLSELPNRSIFAGGNSANWTLDNLSDLLIRQSLKFC